MGVLLHTLQREVEATAMEKPLQQTRRRTLSDPRLEVLNQAIKRIKSPANAILEHTNTLHPHVFARRKLLSRELHSSFNLYSSEGVSEAGGCSSPDISRRRSAVRCALSFTDKCFSMRDSFCT